MCNNSNTRHGFSLYSKSSMNSTRFGCFCKLMYCNIFTYREKTWKLWVTLPLTEKPQTIKNIRCAPKSYLMSDQFKMNWILKNLDCNFLFCFLNLTSGNLSKGTITNDFQNFIFLSCAAQNTFFIPFSKDGEKVKNHYFIMEYLTLLLLFDFFYVKPVFHFLV